MKYIFIRTKMQVRKFSRKHHIKLPIDQFKFLIDDLNLYIVIVNKLVIYLI